MATPKEALTGVSQTININSDAKASPKNQPIGNQDTVTFKNNDPNNAATVTFLGAGADEFSYNGSTVSSVTVTAGGTAGPLTPNNSNLTVDYQVSIAPQQGGPFSIEIGTGPLQIDIVNDEGDTDLPTAEIPNNGTLFFNNEVDGTAIITFDKADVIFDSNGKSVTSQTVNGDSQGATLTGRGTSQHVGYTINIAGHPRRVETGTGTIKVGSN
jgi:hypothetical protein